MKTAMQELIDKIDLKFTDEYDSEVLQSLSDLRKKATKLLEKEREQIENAYQDGYTFWDSELTSVEYYNGNYNQNK